MAKIRVIQAGLGPIGQKVVQFMTERPEIEIVGAVDPNPGIAGKKLARICSLEKTLGIVIQSNFGTAIEAAPADVALLTTVSSLEACAAQTLEIVKHGVHVVSTCEEMAYPWLTAPGLSRQLDQAARQNNVAVLGTGVNPGFLMDFLPTVMTGVCKEVRKIKVSRLQDASIRRIPFQQKIGAGLTLEEFEAKKQTGTLRHVGLTESIHLIAEALGWKLDKTEDILTPVVAEKEITTGYKNIAPGMAAGVQQIGLGHVNGQPLIELVFRAAVGEPEPGDTIEIDGTPSITSTIKDGVNGDIATCAIAVNAVKSIGKAAPGLRVMTDFPTISSVGL